MSPEVFRGYGTAGKEVGPEVLRNKMGFDLEALGSIHHTSPETLQMSSKRGPETLEIRE